MRHAFRFAALSIVATCPCLAQRVAVSINEGGGPFQQPLLSHATYAVPIGSQFGTSTVSAVQFHMAVPYFDAQSVYIFDADPVTNSPRNQLARGTFGVPGNAPGYWGAEFNTPVVLQPQLTYFLCLTAEGGVTMSGPGPSNIMPYFFYDGFSWSGRLYCPEWSFRLYAGQHAGRFVHVGAGKPGTLGLPYIWASGWPNTGNSIELVVSDTLPLSPVVFLVGATATISLPFATLYARPDVMISAVAVRGAATLSIPIPNSASLQGVTIGSQALVADQGATFGISHTQGVEIRIGH